MASHYGRFVDRSAARGLACLAAAALVSGCLSPRHISGPTLNDEVRVGNFAFTVTALHLGVPKTGSRTAQGAFVVVNLRVKNIGAVERSVYCQDQTLRDQAGRKYDNAVNVGSREDRVEIKPGKQVLVTCAFDLPTGTLPATLTVRDSQYARGATVALL